MRRRNVIIPLILFIIVLIFIIFWILRFGITQKHEQIVIEKTESIALRFFINSPEDITLPKSDQDFVLKTIEDKFNVQLNMDYTVSGNDYNSKLTGMLFANDPPDMWIEMNSEGGSKHALDGVLADMTPFISPISMPNYFKYWETEPELKQYQIHNRFYRAPVPYNKNSFRSYYIRKDWLDKLSLPIPNSYSDYLKVLHAFTFDDPDGNGKQDTFGFTTSGNSTSLGTDWPEYLKNDLIYPAYMDNNKLIDMESDSRIGQVLDDILKVSNEGVIDPDWFLNQGTEHIDKAVNGKAGIVLGDTLEFALDADPRSIQSRSVAIQPGANWVPFNPIGIQPMRAGIDPGYPFVFSKMTADRYPEKMKKIVEILDWLSGEEGFLLTHYGIADKDYTRSGNTITLLPDKEQTASSTHKDFLKIWGFFTPSAPNVLGLQVIDPELTIRDQEIKRYLSSLPVKEKLGTALTPPLGIDIGSFRARQNELQVKMLFSDKSGRMWSQYRQEIMTDYNGTQILRNFEDQIQATKMSK